MNFATRSSPKTRRVHRMASLGEPDGFDVSAEPNGMGKEWVGKG